MDGLIHDNLEREMIPTIGDLNGHVRKSNMDIVVQR